MNPLAFLQCHLKDEWRCRLMKVCLLLIERVNPGVDFLMIDNASPIDPRPWLPGEWFDCGVCLPPGTERGFGTVPPIRPADRVLMRFPDAIGHFHDDENRQPPPQDGPGRGIMVGLRMAHLYGYKQVVHHGSDNLCAVPYRRMFDMMFRETACFPKTQDGYYEWDIFLIKDLPWLIESRFIERYDWPSQKPDWQGAPVGELVYENLLQGHFNVLPMRGCRGGMAGVDTHNLEEKYGSGLDWITHVSPEGFAMALRMMGHGDLAPLLRP